ncbi:MAG: pilus assembly protein PilM, partial [Lentisphaerae bacterium]|nr:pilus assembly protein PilM [Lentisphaerota bacterium]
NYRIGYRILSAGHGRTETRLLTAAIPDDEALAVSAAFAIGWPVPVAVELAGLAALTAFEQGPGQAYREQNIGVIVMEERATFAAFFSKGELVLIRKFDFGHGYLSDAIQTSLNVDHATAIKIIADGSFDISQIVKAVAEPFIKQLVISKLFIERRENCQLAKFFVPSGKTVARAWLDEVQAAVGMEVDAWNPLANISLAPAALASSLEGEEVSLAAALGAALGSLEALAES